MPKRRGSEDAASLARRQTAVQERAYRELEPEPPPEALDYLLERYQPHPIGPTAAGRLRSLARQERRSQQQRLFESSWSRPIPGLIVAQRWAAGDAFGCGRQISELDTAFRRATALIELFASGEHVQWWPRPVRPEVGGLKLLDAYAGSFDALWTFYGLLASVATSTPVSLASFASLAWSSSKYASRMAHKWSVRPLEARELAHRPSAADQPPTVAPNTSSWQERTTKKLVPLFKQAVDDGRGLDFHAIGPEGELRFIVTPRMDAGDLGEDVV